MAQKYVSIITGKWKYCKNGEDSWMMKGKSKNCHETQSSCQMKIEDNLISEVMDNDIRSGGMEWRWMYDMTDCLLFQSRFRACKWTQWISVSPSWTNSSAELWNIHQATVLASSCH